MKCFRPLAPGAAALLFIAACSTPDDLTTPTISPQFGTTGNDTVEDVAYGKAGYLYAVGAWNSSDDEREQGFWSNSYGAEAYLKRYDRSGNMVWEKFLISNQRIRTTSMRLLHASWPSTVAETLSSPGQQPTTNVCTTKKAATTGTTT